MWFARFYCSQARSLHNIKVRVSASLSSAGARDAPQSTRCLAVIPHQFTHVSWIDVNAEDRATRVGEQYDLGVIRMIYERADYIRQQRSAPAVLLGVVIMLFILRPRSESREFS